MKIALVFLFVAMPAFAQVQSSVPSQFPPLAASQAASAPIVISGCTPNTWATPMGDGSTLVQVKTDKAKGVFGWCKQPTPDGGDPAKWYWHEYMHQWCLTKPNGDCIDPPAAWDFQAALERVLAASSPDAAINQVKAEFAAARIPVTDPQKVYEVQRLRWTGCKVMRTAPYPNLPIGIVAFTPPGPNPAECGAAPVAPPPSAPPVAVYVVTGAQAFPFDPAGNNGAGVRSITPVPTPPTKGATCDCTTPPMPFMQFGARWCYVAPLVVTGCTLKK